MTARDRVRGCLLGGAIGDALGAPVEFSSMGDIRAEYGEEGITDYARSYGGRVGAWTDDTQMTLFTVEGLLDAARDGTHPTEAIWAAYKRWHQTQMLTGAEGEGLLAIPAMHSRRAPGSTCLSASSAELPGTLDHPINHSKGCGGVMRVAPIGTVVPDPFDLANDAAAMTHGHPSGWLASGALAVMVARLMGGSSKREAVEAGLAAVRDHPRADEVTAALEKALRRAEWEAASPTAVERLGAGWVAEEALAIAAYCFLVADNFDQAVVLGANHTGDSDSTASIAGQLYGTYVGESSIHDHWFEGLEMIELIGDMADRLADAYLG